MAARSRRVASAAVVAVALSPLAAFVACSSAEQASSAPGATQRPDGGGAAPPPRGIGGVPSGSIDAGADASVETDAETDAEAGADADAATEPDPWAPPAVRPSGPPVETRGSNAPGQTPAFPEQTRAPGHPTDVAFDVRVAARELTTPWAVAILPDGALLVNERLGRMRIVATDGTVSDPLEGLPAITLTSQGGLLDVVLDPDFAQTSGIHFSYVEGRGASGTGLVVARATLVREGTPHLANVATVWSMPHSSEATYHYGSRLAFANDGNLFVTVGERGELGGSLHARSLASSYGKVLRLRPDGGIPADNPHVGQGGGALAEIFSRGHRNPQSAAVHPKTGLLWTVEHGPRGGDEINVIRGGEDYGWPDVTYGIDYTGDPIGVTALEGVEQPAYYWDPVIAPSGAAFYDGAAFPGWRGSFFVGSMGQTHLVRLTLDGEKIIGEERLLVGRGRIRDVRVSAAGTIFLVDETNREILELVPR